MSKKLKKIGIGLIGYGGIGRVHAMGFHAIPFHYGLDADSVRIVGVATQHAESAERAGRELGCPHYTDYHELLSRSDIDAIDCTTPNTAHHEVVLAAAAARKHIYCEKPLSFTVDEAREMVSAVERANVVNQVTFNFRFFPALVRAKQLIDAGALGRVFSFHGRYFRSSYISSDKPFSWRLKKESGGGALTDIGSHVIDLTHYLLGPVDSVNAKLETLIPDRPIAAGSSERARVEVDDLCLLQLKLSNSGAFGTLEVSRMGTGTANDIRFEIYGTEGALRFHSEAPSHLEYYNVNDPATPLGGVRGFKRLETYQRYEGNLPPIGQCPPLLGARTPNVSTSSCAPLVMGRWQAHR